MVVHQPITPKEITTNILLIKNTYQVQKGIIDSIIPRDEEKAYKFATVILICTPEAWTNGVNTKSVYPAILGQGLETGM
jgi:hypothetical protein